MSADNLAQRKIYWIASLAVTLMIFFLTLTYHLIFPDLKIIIYYGFFVAAVFLQGVIMPFVSRAGIGVMYMFINQTLVAIATFIAMLKLGGIPHSGGLVFVGLALVFFSLNFKRKEHSIAIFIIYLVTVILTGILHPYLEVPPEMTPTVNVSLFVINLTWISGFALVFILSFISMLVKFEHLEAERLKEVNKVRNKLFTNISHELRTPLTIIRGMTDLIRSDPVKWKEEGCVKIERNTGILLHLVNQMLDLSKLEAGAMQLKMIQDEIQKHIRFIVEMFRSVADKKGITMNFYPEQDKVVMDYDPEKIMMIISNLLSNALKYTRRGGCIEIRTRLMESENKVFEIQVRDNGRGISSKHLPYIFDRFYRAESNGVGSNPGSGLGLAITKELVKMCNGTIDAESIYGKGSKFCICFPITKNAPLESKSDPLEFVGKVTSHLSTFENGRTHFPEQAVIHEERPTLLIVEDNEDVIDYLYIILGNDYELMIASNGEEGLIKALEYIPDIILADIMMPVMDGMEFLKKLKDDIRTSHIPIAMLTARADLPSKLEALEHGVDAYIPKPFMKEELLVHLHALINQRRLLQKHYAAFGTIDLPEEKSINRENLFINKVRNIMITNLKDEKFNLRMLCREIGMSRTQLYRKFKALTDRTPQEYLRSLRLHKAKDMLSTLEISVSEAAYRTGFKNLSHFSRAFREEFSINPSEIQK